MSIFAWLGREAALSNAALTVRVQAVPLSDNGRGGQLLFDALFPRENVPSIKLSEITATDFRPVADRREWNARGRAIPQRLPTTVDFEMVPVESYFKIDEYEIQRLTEQTLGNQELFRRIVGASVPDRTRNLAIANNRRLEVDAFTAWALGQITARNPQLATTQTVSFGFDANRYATAATAWNAAANAYNEFMAWYRDALDLIGGPADGAMLRQATLNEIQKDAPNPFTNLAGVQVTRRQLEQRIQDDIGAAFRFFVNENAEDVFTGAGLEVARTKVWPAQIVAIVPQGGRVGRTAAAPVARAFEIAQGAPGARIDVNGMAAYSELSNGGRELTVECQGNMVPLPNEQNVATINAGV